MQQTESGWKSRGILLFAGIVMIIVGGILPVQAGQTGGVTPAGELLMGLLGCTVQSSSSYAPIKLQADCSANLGRCWEAKGLNKENDVQVQDMCWQGTNVCPKVCMDEYFSRRKAGMNPSQADPLFQGRRGEDTSCVPGVDARVHPRGQGQDE